MQNSRYKFDVLSTDEAEKKIQKRKSPGVGVGTYIINFAIDNERSVTKLHEKYQSLNEDYTGGRHVVLVHANRFGSICWGDPEYVITGTNQRYGSITVEYIANYLNKLLPEDKKEILFFCCYGSADALADQVRKLAALTGRCVLYYANPTHCKPRVEMLELTNQHELKSYCLRVYPDYDDLIKDFWV